MADVGLSIVEGLSRGASAYREPSKRNVGLLGQFVRGESLKPIKVSSLEDFGTFFGGQSNALFGPAIVKAIFDEADGAPVSLYISRVTGKNAKAATGEASLLGGAIMTAKAGQRGAEDVGAWGNGVTLELYSFDSASRGNYVLKISYKDKEETIIGETLSEIQQAVTKISRFAVVNFSQEIPEENKVTMEQLSGTVSASTSSPIITGVGTSFKSTLKSGSALYYNDKLVGTVSSVDSDNQVTLTGKAFIEVPESSSLSHRKDVVWKIVLSGGTDGDAVTIDDYAPNAMGGGLSSFDGFDIQYLATTEFHNIRMAKILKQYCHETKSAIGIVNLPELADEGMAELYDIELGSNEQSFIASYMGWCYVPDMQGNPRRLPVIGPVIGAALIRTPYIQGDFVHIPPAGIDSLFKTVTKMEPNRLGQAMINKLVQHYHCNVIQNVENLGFYVGTSRTHSRNSLYTSIHVRLQTSFYLRSLNSLMRFLEQKPNTPELKREALVSLLQFFKNEYNNGALERSVPFDVAYRGICDASNNPVGQDRKVLNIDCEWIPTECTESIRISLLRNDGVLTATEK
jgi:hypothetical protein